MPCFYGNTGTGKTHLACAIANELLRQGKSALFVRAYEVLRTIRDTWKGGEKTELAVIREFVAPDLLILDEVGVQYGSESERIELF
ncbi:DNA replication protein dnaC, partial [mine drainage metagenome]